jgi:hypothetical protein
MNTPKSLLEAYLQAKDLNQPSVILDCYTPEAVLTYSIATDTIAFPARVEGADAIAQTLVRDFRKNFDSCRTYYVCDSIAPAGQDISFMPWLVIMRQVSNTALRLGRGYYRWGFERDESEMRVREMHIHIERMDIIEDRDGNKRQALHAALPYPWLRPAVLSETFERLRKQSPGFAFLDGFQAPVARPAWKASRVQ